MKDLKDIINLFYGAIQFGIKRPYELFYLELGLDSK